MRVLRPGVQPFVSPVSDARQGRAAGRPVARARIREHHPWHRRQALEPPTQEFRGGGLVATRPHEKVEAVPVPIDGPPQVVRRPSARDEGLVPVPRIARPGPPSAEAVGVGLAEVQAPVANRLVGDDHAALGQPLRHVAIAEREAAVPPHGVADDRGREPVALVAGGGWVLFHARA